MRKGKGNRDGKESESERKVNEQWKEKKKGKAMRVNKVIERSEVGGKKGKMKCNLLIMCTPQQICKICTGILVSRYSRIFGIRPHQLSGRISGIRLLDSRLSGIRQISIRASLHDAREMHRKYAKWKAAYIHNCLKNGETPIAGPLATGEEDDQEHGMEQGWSAK